MSRLIRPLSIGSFLLFTACATATDNPDAGGFGDGGGTASGGSLGATGGTSIGTGGGFGASGANGTGGVFGSTGGAVSTGGTATGGASTGGASTGGAGTGGASTGGMGTGGMLPAGGDCEGLPFWQSGATYATDDQVQVDCTSGTSTHGSQCYGLTDTHVFQCVTDYPLHCGSEDPALNNWTSNIPWARLDPACPDE